jgi:dTDP-4-amino-4,6-dideoxygalactose transaminase
MTRIYLSPPDVGALERDLVIAAIDSNWVAPVGPDLDAFEHDLAAISSRQQAVGVSNGTAGLHLCLHALGIGAGQRVAVSTFTFAASANAIAYTGAEPVFIDSEASSWNIDVDLLAAALDEGRRSGRPIAAVLAVDLYGQCCDYDRVDDVCKLYGAVLISDAAESLGAKYKGRDAGSVGHAAVFSFNGNKIITTSSGGMVVTDDHAFAQRLRYLATQAREPAPHYEHIEVGFNYRLSNLLAAFGRGQVATLFDRVVRRRAINRRYRAEFAELPVTFAPIPEWSEPNYWLSCFAIDPDASVEPEQIRLALEEHDIESRPLWKPMHVQAVFKAAPSYLNGVSDDLFRRGLCLPSGSSLGENEQARVIEIVQTCFANGRSSH